MPTLHRALAILALCPLFLAYAQKPSRLDVRLKPASPKAGQSCEIIVALQAPSGAPAHAPRDLEIHVAIRPIQSNSGQQSRRITIPGGHTSASLPWTFPATGPVEIRATHPELAEGRSVVMISQQQLRHGPMLLAVAAPATASARVKISPQKDCKPNNPCNVSAWVEPAIHSPVTLELITDSGHLSSHELTIPGENVGEVNVTTSQRGEVPVRIVYSPLPVVDETGAPIDHFNLAFNSFRGLPHLSVDQTKLGLFETALIHIEWWDADSKSPAPPLAPTEIALSVQGRGRLSQPVKLGPEKPSATTVFSPESLGTAVIQPVSSVADGQPVFVAFPWGLFALSAISSALVGWVASQIRAGTWKALSIGMLSGVALYWIGVFTALPLLPDSLRALCGNPLTVFFGTAVPVAALIARVQPAASPISLATIIHGASSVVSPRTVFISYAHADSALCEELKTHLSALTREGLILAWTDRQILPGTCWDSAIHDNLESSDLVLLLVSADFIASDYCMGIELKCALERASKAEALVIPIILRACDWKTMPFAKYQALPEGASPVTSSHWQNHDEAFSNIAESLRHMIQSMPNRATHTAAV